MSPIRARMMENFSRAAAEYDTRAQFQQTETARVLDAALMIFPERARIADIGCGTGYFAEIAHTKRPDWNIIGIDIAQGMCEVAATRCTAIRADAIALPLDNESCDAVISSLCLQWVEQLPQAFAELFRVLRPGGRAVIASLGQQSLQELRDAANQAELPLGLLPMQSAQNYRSAIEAAGFETTMFRQEVEVEYYAGIHALLGSMRRIGAGNPAASSGLTGVRRWKTMCAAYETKRTAQGLPAAWDRLFMVLHKPL